jgi:hypothetical protein
MKNVSIKFCVKPDIMISETHHEQPVGKLNYKKKKNPDSSPYPPTDIFYYYYSKHPVLGLSIAHFPFHHACYMSFHLNPFVLKAPNILSEM